MAVTFVETLCIQLRIPGAKIFRNKLEWIMTVWNLQTITVSHPMNCVARKMWGIHDAVRAHKARRHFRFSLTSIPSIPKRDLYRPSRP